MIETLTPYSNTARTAEIMSRYRPIAPKPENPDNPMKDSSSLSQKIKQSPYLRNLWPQLQARPTRTRKRGRAAFALPSLKRHKTHVLGFCPPCHITSPQKNISLQGFAPGVPQLPLPKFGMLDDSNLEETPKNPSLITLPLLPCSFPALGVATALEIDLMKPGREEVIDLNTVPEEKDLLKHLQGQNVNVIAPQPIRPVVSSISVGCINEDPTLPPPANASKKREEVEKEVEAEAWPAVISDSNNKVRMANSAYKEMVGQPECSWLDSMVTSDGRLPCRRISGEVTLNVGDSVIPNSSNGFQCWVRIEWRTNDNKSSVDTYCDVIRISCESSDYLFAWRFHTCPRESSQSSYHV
ncbi:hypothetical protein L6164_024573 [Bauhinia variegata]|uniref:Uncharacterized protein n=1 Tax=Bauhinia variegata TaxID=167791 RepID=A0ACB9LZC4_BAUVA|nr:hypothetical protein L6164_024573 [Bauhinia variegata]